MDKIIQKFYKSLKEQEKSLISGYVFQKTTLLIATILTVSGMVVKLAI